MSSADRVVDSLRVEGCVIRLPRVFYHHLLNIYVLIYASEYYMWGQSGINSYIPLFVAGTKMNTGRTA